MQVKKPQLEPDMEQRTDSKLGKDAVKVLGWLARFEGGSRARGHMYTYSWFMLMYGRIQHNIVKQFSAN